MDKGRIEVDIYHHKYFKFWSNVNSNQVNVLIRAFYRSYIVASFNNFSI